MMEFVSKKVNELVSENYEYASVLHHLGISFYHYSDETLAQVCKQKGLDMNPVVKSLEKIGNEEVGQVHWDEFPIDLILEYLKHGHAVFIKHKLPYMANLIENLDIKKIKNRQIIRDLQTLFPLFAEEFILHIHEEEDTFFKYLDMLHKASSGNCNPTELHYEMEKNLLQIFALEHHLHDDEIRGIREITDNYALDKNATLHLKVLFSELKSFENELLKHSKIEDCILLPKAIHLEKRVKAMLSKNTRLN